MKVSKNNAKRIPKDCDGVAEEMFINISLIIYFLKNLPMIMLKEVWKSFLEELLRSFQMNFQFEEIFEGVWKQLPKFLFRNSRKKKIK